MKLGIDVSTYFEELQLGAKYFDGDKEIEPLEMFRRNGVDLMRIRLWVNPFGENGEPYLGGTCDLNNFFALAKVAKQKGFGIMLDFHYSDFWSDPSKQSLPKSWSNLSGQRLVEKVYSYTRDVLREAARRNVEIEYIQTGNEITNGMLWPHGQLRWNEQTGERTGYENLCALLAAGGRACREIYPGAKIVLHLERSYDQGVYNEFFGNMQRFGIDYDVIGMSYYPSWHGTFEQLFANVEAMKKFGREIAVVETGYPFSSDDYLKQPDGNPQHMVVTGNGLLPHEFSETYPISEEGQCRFLSVLLRGAKQHGVSAVMWWEPLWIPGENVCWTSLAGQRYSGDTGKSTRNDWANQCLFDYEGRKLPAFDVFSVKNEE